MTAYFYVSDGQLDHSYALLALPQAQELMGYREDQITGVELKVDDPFKVQEWIIRC